jgi:hypothetical protein
MRDTPEWSDRLEDTQKKTTTDLERRDTEDFKGKKN